MQTPLQITFRHLQSSPAVEARVREYVERLDKMGLAVYPPEGDRISSTEMWSSLRAVGTIRGSAVKTPSTSE